MPSEKYPEAFFESNRNAGRRSILQPLFSPITGRFFTLYKELPLLVVPSSPLAMPVNKPGDNKINPEANSAGHVDRIVHLQPPPASLNLSLPAKAIGSVPTTSLS